MVNLADLRKKKKKEEKKEELAQEKKEVKENIAEDLKEVKEVLKEEIAPPKIEKKMEEEGENELFLCFSIGKEIYGIQIDYIQEIIPVYLITKVPNAPKEIIGIISIRGQVLPVLDIGIFLGQKFEKITEDTKLIILRVKDEMVSIIVDKVYQNISIPLKSIEQAPSTVKDEKGLIFGVYPFKKRLLILLKAEQI